MNTITDSIQVQPLKLDNGDKAAFKSYSTNSFESFFKKAMELYNETNIYQNEAEQMQRDFVKAMILLRLIWHRQRQAPQFSLLLILLQRF